MKLHRCGFASVAGIACILTAPASFAQDYRARIQGLIADSSGGAVAGARIALRNVQTGVETGQVSNGVGQYLFNFVEPGTYNVSAEMAGFSKSVQENVLVQTRGDITVNFVLKPGAVVETVDVSADAVAVQFNTSTMDLTVDRKMLNDLPIMQRNPFTLALLDPAVVNRYWTDRNPFFMWSSSNMDVGGNTTQKNDLLLDGAPLMLGPKGSYSPPMDAVQEFSVQQNSVDAEFGHSAGGILSLAMKSGTNEFHGTASYFGRNPMFNARSNSYNNTKNLVRNHIWGGTLGNPILKNKLFTFTSYEAWRKYDPKETARTMPTDLERSGDFSQSLNIKGGLRAIYDPWTTQLDQATNTATRQPFPGNRIPQNRIDPTAARFMKDIWRPNSPGDNITGINNFRIGYSWPIRYWNFSNRTDWNVNDHWKLFARYSRVRTDLDSENYANSPAVKNDNGGLMNNRNIAGDAVWTENATTVWNFRVSFASLEDDYNAPTAAIGEKGLEQFWPGNPWYKPYIGEMPAIYYPSLSVGGGSYGMGSYWYQHPRNYHFETSMRKSVGTHNLKVGGQHRRHRGDGIYPNLMNFSFSKTHTAATYISPDLLTSGDDWAAFLLGAVDSNSYAQTWPFQRLGVNYWAAFVQDDWKVSRNITLNLGLRYEWEGAPYDSENRLTRFVDLNDPIPEMQKTPPPIPADVQALMKVPYKFNGAFHYTDDQHRSAYDTGSLIFMPRAGIAIRLNDKSAIRIGYARFVTPALVTANTLSRVAMLGFNAATNVLSPITGVPQARLSDPFPSSNPLLLPVGKKYGRYTNLGDSVSWTEQDYKSGVNDRINFSIQRQLPNQFHLDATFFMNFGHDLPYTLNLNQVDPQLSYTYKSALDRGIPNPFRGYLTPETFPGALRNRPTVTVGSLLKPYPQYTGASQAQTAGLLNRYKALQLRLQRNFTNGYSILMAYNYNRESNTTFFNAPDQYANRFTFLPSDNPRHRFNIAGTYDLPFGKGRPYGSNMHPLLNAVFGGWTTSHILWFNSGPFIRFGQLIVEGDPIIDNPTREKWFNTAAFRRPEPYTPRTNPYQYEGLTGPRYWELDSTLKKEFGIVERLKLELMMEAYNLTNSFIPTNPVTNVNSSTFGRSTNQANRGREMQYSLRLVF